jgi:hypothetical protein
MPTSIGKQYSIKMINCEDDILLEQTELIEHTVHPQIVHKINLLNKFFERNINLSNGFRECQKIFPFI